jgi:hypothetical protein
MRLPRHCKRSTKIIINIDIILSLDNYHKWFHFSRQRGDYNMICIFAKSPHNYICYVNHMSKKFR